MTEKCEQSMFRTKILVNAANTGNPAQQHCAPPPEAEAAHRTSSGSIPPAPVPAAPSAPPSRAPPRWLSRWRPGTWSSWSSRKTTRRHSSFRTRKPTTKRISQPSNWATSRATAGPGSRQGVRSAVQQILDPGDQSQHPQAVAGGGAVGTFGQYLAQPLGHIGLHLGHQPIHHQRCPRSAISLAPNRDTSQVSSPRQGAEHAPTVTQDPRNSSRMAIQIKSGNS